MSLVVTSWATPRAAALQPGACLRPGHIHPDAVVSGTPQNRSAVASGRGFDGMRQKPECAGRHPVTSVSKLLAYCTPAFHNLLEGWGLFAPVRATSARAEKALKNTPLLGLTNRCRQLNRQDYSFKSIPLTRLFFIA